MENNVDEEFYERADAHIHLSNSQLKDTRMGVVSASMMYGTARFNAYVSACGFSSQADMVLNREEVLEYFITQYRAALIENYDDYATNFDSHMSRKPNA